jgi:hypothetical protein
MGTVLVEIHEIRWLDDSLWHVLNTNSHSMLCTHSMSHPCYLVHKSKVNGQCSQHKEEMEEAQA